MFLPSTVCHHFGGRGSCTVLYGKKIPDFGPDFGDLGFYLVGFGGFLGGFGGHIWTIFGEVLACFSYSFGGFQ